jgi:hypothetical protein
VRGAVALVLLGAILASACGRKGDPLPPLRPLPGRLADLALRRVDDRLELRFTVPAANADGTTPSAIDHIDVYQVTTAAGAPNPTATDIEQAQNLKHQVKVESPKSPESSKSPKSSESPKSPASAQAAAPKPETKPPVDPSAAIRQAAPGEQILVVDTIPSGTTTGVINYLVVGAAGRRRQQSPVVRVPLETLPPAPHDLTFTYDEKQLTLKWQTGDVAGQKFRVSDVDREGHLRAGTPTSEPLSTPTMSVPVEFGKERCFEVRTVQTQGSVTIESVAAHSCTTPEDTFMPAAPANLRAFAGEASVRLTWDAVDASDLAGYIVLRGEGTGATLQALTTTLTETTFTDTKAVPGVTYWYSVVAIDKSNNMSGQSNRVQSTAR